MAIVPQWPIIHPADKKIDDGSHDAGMGRRFGGIVLKRCFLHIGRQRRVARDMMRQFFLMTVGNQLSVRRINAGIRSGTRFRKAQQKRVGQPRFKRIGFGGKRRIAM